MTLLWGPCVVVMDPRGVSWFGPSCAQVEALKGLRALRTLKKTHRERMRLRNGKSELTVNNYAVFHWPAPKRDLFIEDGWGLLSSTKHIKTSLQKCTGRRDSYGLKSEVPTSQVPFTSSELLRRGGSLQCDITMPNHSICLLTSLQMRLSIGLTDHIDHERLISHFWSQLQKGFFEDPTEQL